MLNTRPAISTRRATNSGIGTRMGTSTTIYIGLTAGIANSTRTTTSTPIKK
jgi:hypothetical protein